MFKKPKILIIISFFFILLIHLFQINQLPKPIEKFFDFIGILVGPFFLFIFIFAGLYGIILFFSKLADFEVDNKKRYEKINRKNNRYQIKSKVRKNTNLVEKLKKIKKLYMRGSINKDEFEKAKNKMLS